MTTLTLLRLIQSLFNFYSLLVLAYCLLTWFPIRAGGVMEDIGHALATLVEPYLGLFRRFIPPMGGIDWSPVIAILVLNLLENLVLRLVL